MHVPAGLYDDGVRCIARPTLVFNVESFRYEVNVVESFELAYKW